MGVQALLHREGRKKCKPCHGERADRAQSDATQTASWHVAVADMRMLWAQRLSAPSAQALLHTCAHACSSTVQARLSPPGLLRSRSGRLTGMHTRVCHGAAPAGGRPAQLPC